MKKSKIARKLLTFVFPLFILFANAQNNDEKLSIEEFLLLVKTYHPIALQTDIELKKSEKTIQLARSSFDPIINFYSAKKSLDGKDYYTNTASEITIPTWYGIEIYAGREYLAGDYTNPSDTKGTQNFLGASIPLARNLIIDKRRAALQQAKILNQLALTEQRIILNDLLMEAAETYIQWAKLHQNQLILKEIISVNKERISQVEKYVELGERPKIDIIEANTQLQYYELLYSQNLLDLQNARLEMSVYLWTANQSEYVLPEIISPNLNLESAAISLFELDYTQLEQSASQNHPYLSAFEQKLSIFDIDRKLKFQELLPKIDFNYNLLSNQNNFSSVFQSTDLFRHNFQYGLKVEIPILFREGRANYVLAKYKIAETKLEQSHKRRDLLTKLKIYHNQFENFKSQVVLSEQSYQYFQKLLQAEKTKFDNGESSLFFINSRENKLFEAQQKLIDTQFKLIKSIYSLQWSAGILA